MRKIGFVSKKMNVWMALGALFAIVNVMSSVSLAGPAPDLVCRQHTSGSGYKAVFRAAIMSPLIWVDLYDDGKELGRFACEPKSKNAENNVRIYICQNGIDDRYNANQGDYRMILQHNLANKTSSAVAFQSQVKLAELSDCQNEYGDDYEK